MDRVIEEGDSYLRKAFDTTTVSVAPGAAPVAVGPPVAPVLVPFSGSDQHSAQHPPGRVQRPWGP